MVRFLLVVVMDGECRHFLVNCCKGSDDWKGAYMLLWLWLFLLLLVVSIPATSRATTVRMNETLEVSFVATEINQSFICFVL